ncbi:kelch-like protein 25 [Arctopsyche grandis]|uniref:kelch-like protein 25 n=1 Tax=Arctopsyche grandis TaxID=121162 RepID=UPI00406D8088
MLTRSSFTTKDSTDRRNINFLKMSYHIEANAEFVKKRFEKLYTAFNYKEKYTDVEYTVGDRSIFAHKVVLSVCSEIFVKQSVQYVNDIFVGFENVVIDAIFKFCYTGIIDIDMKKYHKFKELATKLQITTIYYKTINKKNCLEVLTLSNDPKSIATAMDLILNHFEKLYITKDFLQLPISQLIEIIKSDYLDVSSEMHVLKSIKLWVEEDSELRKLELPDLLRYVKLTALTMEINLTDVLSSFYSTPEYNKMINDTVASILNTDQRKNILNTDRRWKIEKIALVGSSLHAIRNRLEIFDCKENKWRLSKDFGFFRTDYASTVVDGYLLVIGGLNSTKVDCFNLEKGTKETWKPLNVSRWKSSAVTISDKSSIYVYVIGGYNEKKGSLNSVERWNNNKSNEMEDRMKIKWDKKIAPMKLAVAGHSSVVIGDTIYVTGGRTNDTKIEKTSNKLQIYSTSTNTWSFCTPMNHRREGHSSVLFYGDIYVAGGRSSNMDNTTVTTLDSVEYYNPKGKTWTEIVNLPKPLFGLSLCVFRNKLLCIGGLNGLVPNSEVYEYNYTTNNWNSIESLSATRYGLPLMAHVIPYNSAL